MADPNLDDLTIEYGYVSLHLWNLPQGETWAIHVIAKTDEYWCSRAFRHTQAMINDRKLAVAYANELLVKYNLDRVEVS